MFSQDGPPLSEQHSFRSFLVLLLLCSQGVRGYLDEFKLLCSGFAVCIVCAPVSEIETGVFFGILQL